MEVRVNGRPVGADRSGHMGWSFEQLVVARLARFLGEGRRGAGLRHLLLRARWPSPGAAPVGCDPPPLQVGDVVEMTIERLGTIANRIVADTDEVPPVPAARRRTRESV